MAKKSTRDMILDVASTLFATKGFRVTTMETIAVAAGRGRRTVYMYFHNKVEIYNAVVEKEILTITTALREAVNTETPPQDILTSYARARIDTILRLLKRNPLLMKDMAHQSARIEKLRERLNNEELKIIAPLFQEWKRQSLVSETSDPADMAVTFLNLLRGNDRLLSAEGQEKKAYTLAQLACTVFLSGIK